MNNNKCTIGFALSGSFCSFRKSIEQMKLLVEQEYKVIPIMSENASSIDTRFGLANDFIKEVEEICGCKVISTITGAEPIGPKKMLDILAICPCTGNTLSKLSNAITDTSVTMAAKSHLRIKRPVVIALASNDALGASAQNIGKIINVKNIYFVPFSQDNYEQKENSIVSNFDLLLPTIKLALQGKQLQPVIDTTSK